MPFHLSEDAKRLIQRILVADPTKRPTAQEVIQINVLKMLIIGNDRCMAIELKQIIQQQPQ